MIVLPGSEGTESEMMLAIRYRTPVIAYFGAHDVTWAVPQGVAVARTLADVERFVQDVLGDRSPRV